MQSFRFTNDLWDTILNKLRCKYFEVSTENIQNENVYCQVMRQDAFKDMCEYEASIWVKSFIICMYSGEATGGGGMGGSEPPPTFHQDLFCNSYKYDKELVGGCNK